MERLTVNPTSDYLPEPPKYYEALPISKISINEICRLR
jgi:hypothetical protein